MKRSGIILICIAMLLLSIGGCSDDPLEPIQANDTTVTIDENPIVNTPLVTISASSSEGPVTFAFETQEPAGALAINSVTGKVTVLNEFAFDYEANPTINAIITISDGINSDNIRLDINLNDIPEIFNFLSTSLVAYQNAANNNWVLIFSEAEYNALADGLSNITKSSTSDGEFDASVTVEDAGVDNTIANHNGHTIPTGSYLFAFKYHTLSASSIGDKVLLSENSIEGTYSQIGSDLPLNGYGIQYFVLKGNNTHTSNEGFLGLYYSTIIGYKNLPAANIYHYGSGSLDFTLPDWYNNATFLYQGLSAIKRQW